MFVLMDGFEVLAAPSRRRILTELRRSPRSVNELVDALAANQPTVSKHLRLLRQAGFVSCRGDGQQRIYQLEPAPFRDLEAWLAPYRRLWSKHLDALERHLSRREKR
jgi:DNA-binding transcriptional ArsR family regulator